MNNFTMNDMLHDKSVNTAPRADMSILDTINDAYDTVTLSEDVDSEIKLLSGVMESYEMLTNTDTEYLKVEDAYNLPVIKKVKGDRKLNAKRLAGLTVDVLIFKMWSIIEYKVDYLTKKIELLVDVSKRTHEANVNKIDKLLDFISKGKDLSYKDMSIQEKNSVCRSIGIFSTESGVIDAKTYLTIGEIVKNFKTTPAIVASMYNDIVETEVNYDLNAETISSIDTLVNKWFTTKKKYPKVYQSILEDVNKKVHGTKSSIRWFNVKGHISLTNNPKHHKQAEKFEREIPYLVTKKTIRTLAIANRGTGNGTEKVFLIDYNINPLKILENAISVSPVELEDMKRVLLLTKKVHFKVLEKEVKKLLTLVKKQTPTKNLDIDVSGVLTATQRKTIDTEVRFLMTRRLTILKMVKNVVVDQTSMITGVVDSVKTYTNNFKK